jgi:hypothetical protein
VTLTHLQAAAATGILLLLVIAGTVAVTLPMLALVEMTARPVACEYKFHLDPYALTVH